MVGSPAPQYGSQLRSGRMSLRASLIDSRVDREAEGAILRLVPCLYAFPKVSAVAVHGSPCEIAPLAGMVQPLDVSGGGGDADNV